MNIKVYSTQTCPYCVTLKEFFKANNVAFEDVDVSFDAQLQQEMIDKSGQMGVPVVDINGEIVVGFDKERISQLLGLKS